MYFDETLSILSLVSTHAGVDGACAGHAEVAAVAHVLDVDSVVRGGVVLGEYRCKYHSYHSFVSRSAVLKQFYI